MDKVSPRSTTERPARSVRSWYGLRAEIEVENELWHLVRVGRVALPHPPVVNLILRRGLPPEDRLRLSFLHEFGHLQTLPVALAHAALLLLAGQWRGRGMRSTLSALGAAVVAHETVWELASETYAVASAGPDYRRVYRAHPNRVGQAIFWGGMTALAALATLNLLRRRS